MAVFDFSSIKIQSIFAFLIAIILSYCYLKPKKNDWPPCYSGWIPIPWIGCAIEFGKGPLVFIDDMKRKMGSVFTLKVAGKRLTFLTQCEDFDHFFTSESVDFQKAVQIPVRNTASITEEAFFKYHTKIHDIVRNCLAQSKLDDVCCNLESSFREHFQTIWDDLGSGDLFQLIQQTMYAGVMDNLFGRGILPTKNKDELKKFSDFFVEFDDKFEYAAQIPPVFLRKWSEAKRHLLNRFKEVVQLIMNEGNEPKTILEHVVNSVDSEFSPNFSLMLLWASLANAIPMTFWTASLIINDKLVLKKVKDELEQVLHSYKDKPEGEKQVTMANISDLVYLKKCVLETIRLHSPGVITRQVVKDIYVKGMVIPAGDLLMISPYWTHRNEQLFPNAEQFLPERWDQVDVKKNQLLEGFVAFGGGRYMCPGRWFTLMEIQLFIAILLGSYDVTLLQGVPMQSEVHVVGTQTPSEPCPVEYSRTIS